MQSPAQNNAAGKSKNGSEGRLAGNNLRCVGKYLYDKGFVDRDVITVETASGVKRLELFIRDALPADLEEAK